MTENNSSRRHTWSMTRRERYWFARDSTKQETWLFQINYKDISQRKQLEQT